MRFRGSLAIPALMLGVFCACTAAAQDASFDSKALDAAVSTTKPKGKKAKAEVKPAEKPGKAQDRQFGELEGWSPGKAPPKKKEDERPTSSGIKPPVSVSPSGNMSVGLPF